jgi:VIT1/CCC1 family predicted Fe2+/Mn2+ transporter
MNENLVQLSVAIGVFFPILAALVKQQGWSQRANAIVATVLAGVAGAVTAAMSDPGLSLETWGQSAVAIFVAAVAAFAGFYNPTGIDTAIKNATSFKKA